MTFVLSTVLAVLMTPWGENGAYLTGHADYPRPQLVRANWTNLNGLWDYSLETNTVNGIVVERARGKIRVPFCFESALSGVGVPVTPEDRMIYRRTVELHPRRGFRTLLNFEAVDYSTQVFVNGVEATDVPHEGGNLPFSVDITPYVKDGVNRLEVKVWDPTEGQFGGRGKQALNPSGCYYTRVSGIWQTVWLEEVPEDYIRDCRITTDIDNSTARFEFDLAGRGDVMVKVDEVSQSGESGESGEVVVKIPNAELWSPENPKLYEFTAKYGEDEVRGYFAFRSVSKAVDAQGHMRFFLNGRPFYPLATLDQGWWPDGLLTPPCEEAMAFDLRMLKDMGFNSLRKHIKVEPRRYYYLCDRLGLAVIQDLPSGHEGMAQIDKPAARRRYGFARGEFKEMIDHLRNEPCIIMWMPYNEGWGQPTSDLTRETLRWTRRYDPSRLVGGPSGWDDWEGGRHMKSWLTKWKGGFETAPEALAADGEMSADTVDWHVYPGPALPVADRGRLSFLGEFGGLGLRVPGHLWKEDAAWGYGDTSKATDPNEMQGRYLKLMSEVRGLVGKGLAGSVYTQTSDVEIEINGLATYDRKVVKYDVMALRAAHKAILSEVEKLIQKGK